VFNQPLSLDTSEVTAMEWMFYVRSARALGPNSLKSGLPRACRLRRRRLTPYRLPARTSPRFACPSLSTRQIASAFNQPLSFDTSKVTSMRSMFYVRSARALRPSQALNRAFPENAACATAAPRPPTSRPAPPSASHASPFDSAERVRLQPAAEL
jgi:hypothetical protein